jgi:hypothetical protein
VVGDDLEPLPYRRDGHSGGWLEGEITFEELGAYSNRPENAKRPGVIPGLFWLCSKA